MFFNLVSIALEAANELRLVGALLPLGDDEYLRAIEPEQLDGLASLSVESYGFGFGASLIFFGCECPVLGYLIFRSGYIPKALGVLLPIAGLCYLTNSFAFLVGPSFADPYSPPFLFLLLLARHHSAFGFCGRAWTSRSGDRWQAHSPLEVGQPQSRVPMRIPK